MPWGRTLTFTDPFPYQSAMQTGDVGVYPTKRGEFHSELTQIGLHQLWMQRYHEKLPRVFSSKIKPDRKVIAFLTDENQPAMRHCSVDVPAHVLMVAGSDEIYQRSEASCRYASMSLPMVDLASACRALIGRELVFPPSTYLTKPDHSIMTRLEELHQAVGLLAKNTPYLLDLPEVARNLEQQLVHLMVRSLAEGVLSELRPGNHRTNAIVNRFEELLEANPDRPLYLAEICSAIGVPERTLRSACEEHLGLGPIRYLSLRRMHLVRRALLSGDSLSTTVTRVATDYGFWELGRFSVAYRNLFGESPSETLRRPADGQPASVDRRFSLIAANRRH